MAPAKAEKAGLASEWGVAVQAATKYGPSGMDLHYKTLV